MNQLLAILARLNPLTWTLRVSRRLVTTAITAPIKPVLLVGAIVVGCTVAGAGLYIMYAPIDTALAFAKALQGGAPNLPASRAACIPDSPAVRDGRYVPAAQRVIDQIPPNATITSTTAYLLYRLSHLHQGWQPTWDEWSAYLTDRAITKTASDTDIALSVDPHTDYSPYLVPSRSTAIELAVQGPVVADKRQLANLADQIYRTCEQTAEHTATTPPITTGPPQPDSEYTENPTTATIIPNNTERGEQ